MYSEYERFLLTQNKQVVRYVHVLKAWYDRLESAVRFYNKCKKDLIGYRFEMVHCKQDCQRKANDWIVAPRWLIKISYWIKKRYGHIEEFNTIWRKFHDSL